MTTAELTTFYDTLAKRITQLEALMKRAISDRQLNQVTLLLESEINTLKTDVANLQSRLTTLENTVNGLV